MLAVSPSSREALATSWLRSSGISSCLVTGVQELVFCILEDAFAAKGIQETGESQSMLGNLATVPEDPLAR